jgi:hypothetical protein
MWIALRRAPRDHHARRNLLRLLLSCLPFFAYLGWYVFFIRGALVDLGRDGLLVIGCSAGFGVLLTLIIAYRQRSEARAYDRDNPAVAPEIKLSIYRETCLLATLLERLGSEVAMEKEFPPDIKVITRRILLDQLTQLKLRDDLEPWLLDVLLAPDGHWSSELKARAMPAWECLAALRWVIGIADLRALTVNPKYNISDVRSIIDVKKPEKLNVLPPWDIRPARDAADLFFSRCWAELTARRELENLSEEDVSKALEARETIQSDGYTGDYLVGAMTVSELPSPTLWFLTVRAYNRWRTLSLMVDITSAEKAMTELRSLFAQFFTPTSSVEPATSVENIATDS